jgi:hypothetical protein
MNDVDGASSPGEAKADGCTSFTFHTFLIFLAFMDGGCCVGADFGVCGFLSLGFCDFCPPVLLSNLYLSSFMSAFMKVTRLSVLCGVTSTSLTPCGFGSYLILIVEHCSVLG